MRGRAGARFYNWTQCLIFPIFSTLKFKMLLYGRLCPCHLRFLKRCSTHTATTVPVPRLCDGSRWVPIISRAPRGRVAERTGATTAAALEYFSIATCAAIARMCIFWARQLALYQNLVSIFGNGCGSEASWADSEVNAIGLIVFG